MRRSGILAAALAVLLVMGISACGQSEGNDDATITPVETAEPGMPNGVVDPSSPFLPGQPGEAISPDTVVATVNAEEITRGQFDTRFTQASSSYAMQGVDITNPEVVGQIEEQVIQQLINEALVLQAAEQEGMSADQGEIDRQFDEIVAGFESEADFQSQLSANNLTAEQLRQNIADGMLIESYIDDHIARNVAPEELEVSEEEIVDLYETYTQQIEHLPPLDEVRQGLEAQLHEQKITVVVSALLEDLAAGSEIEILM
jgi:parvulin-like peptidyl-prolyl isomerase